MNLIERNRKHGVRQISWCSDGGGAKQTEKLEVDFIMSQKRYLQIVDFDDQLHYKDKNPIWIKLYCSLLEDYAFAKIPDETKFHAVGLMILAARLNNRLPDDEVWLRQKINANATINLKLLLEIGFLEPIRGRRRRAENSFNAHKSMKTNGNHSRAVFATGLEQNRTEQKRTEENTTQQNTTEETREAVAPDAEAAEEENRVVVLCELEKSSENNTEAQKPPPAAEKASAASMPATALAAKNGHLSMFSLEECLKYAQKAENVRNPQGLAAAIYKTGTADAFIKAKLYPEKALAEDAKTFGEPLKFSDEPCTVCFGARMEIVQGKGARACPHCKNERGKSTGLEPEEQFSELAES